MTLLSQLFAPLTLQSACYYPRLAKQKLKLKEVESMTKPSKWSWLQLVFGLSSENRAWALNLCVLTKHFCLQVVTGLKQNDLMAMKW